MVEGRNSTEEEEWAWQRGVPIVAVVGASPGLRGYYDVYLW